MTHYPIYRGQDQIGTATVVRKGLFYQIRCRCNMESGIPLRVRALGTQEVDLGICVPMGEYLSSDISLPIKKLGEGELSFYVPTEKAFLLTAVETDKPFTDISRLKDAYLIKHGGTVGIGFRFTGQSPNLQGSDQNP